uniref:Uncharacterized protein n=1 Tax=viral metagenome TaxID=1070528 RepID=A0A6M3M6L2_9ZZZZ
MKKTIASTEFIVRMNEEANRLRGLAVAFDKAIAQFGAKNLAASLKTPCKTPA